MRRLLTEVEKAKIVEREWAKARAKNPKVVMRVNVQDETDESGKPKVNVVIAFQCDRVLKRGYVVTAHPQTRSVMNSRRII
jgi:hypothetical protein